MRIVWLQRGAVFNERGYSRPRAPGDEDEVSPRIGGCLIAARKARRVRPRGPAPVAEIIDIEEGS